MCGFLQVIERGRPVAETRFTRAFDLIQHRGPDYRATWFRTLPSRGAPLTVAAGHHRLAILDLDERSHQPFHRGSHTLLFNGEIYNFADLKHHAALRDIAWQTTGDTEVLCEGLRRIGPEFLQHANGMWALTLLDAGALTLFASCDRYGKKPLFWYQDETTLCFASTNAAICHYLDYRPVLREQPLHEYLLTGKMFPSADDRTHLERIRRVPGGHHLHVNLATWQTRLEPFFQPTRDQLHHAADQTTLAEIVRDAARVRMVSDRQVGLLLSGGVDSTLVLAALYANQLHDRVHCFIGEAGRSEDADYARRSAAQLGITATEITLRYDEGAFDRFLRMCQHHEKAFPLLGNSMAMAEMYEAVAQHNIPVVLDGTGGDELFGGYWGRCFPVAVRDTVRHRDRDWWRSTAWLPVHRAKTWRALRTWPLQNSRWNLDLHLLRKCLHPLPLWLGVHAPVWRRSPDPAENPQPDFTAALLSEVQPGGRLAEWIWHNDRNAMMSGIENRSPLLDYRLVPFLGTGYREKLHGPYNKYELRRLFDAFAKLPTQWRTEKQGFRWHRKRFLTDNRARILDVIAASEFLQTRFRIQRFVDLAHRSDRVFHSSLTARLLCLAGVDRALHLRPAS